MKNNWIGSLLVGGLLVAVGAFGAYYSLTKGEIVKEPQQNVEVSPTPTASEEPVAVEEEEEESSNIPAGWLTYERTDFGFRISYPNNFEALDDANNLYGWDDAVVLLYSGGQSYDIAVEVWDTVAEYEAKYPGGNYVVIEVGGQYVTAANMNMTPIGGQIIGTLEVMN